MKKADVIEVLKLMYRNAMDCGECMKDEFPETANRMIGEALGYHTAYRMLENDSFAKDMREIFVKA